MPVVALLSNKGGVGKTTLSVNIASAMHRLGKALLLDADPQQSAYQWRALSDYADMVPVANASDDLVASIAEYQDQHDYLLIDCPPSVQSEQTQAALVHSDWVIIPVLPSPLDLWASVKIEAEIDKAREMNPDLQAMLVINQLEPRTLLSQAIRNATAELTMRTAQTSIYRRMVYRNTVLEGRSVFDAGAAGRAAAKELSELLKEIGIHREQ
jgi:chromosome partitioning protein